MNIKKFHAARTWARHCFGAGLFCLCGSGAEYDYLFQCARQRLAELGLGHAELRQYFTGLSRVRVFDQRHNVRLPGDSNCEYGNVGFALRQHQFLAQRRRHPVEQHLQMYGLEQIGTTQNEGVGIYYNFGCAASYTWVQYIRAIVELGGVERG